MEQKPVDQLLEFFSEHFNGGRLIKITLSKQRNKNSDLRNIIISPVNLRTGMMLHSIYRHKTRDISKNHSLEEAKNLIINALEKEFLQLDMYVAGENFKLIISKRENAKLLRTAVEAPAPVSFSHDRQKERIIPVADIPWMRGLGLVNDKGELRHEMKDKYLQINRYIELLTPEITRAGLKDPVTIADMGSGKGYLTFALYEYLQNHLSRKVSMTGIEYRSDLVNLCNEVAKASGFKGLKFAQGAIGETEIPPCDILIALHACDTATDDAIFKGIEMGAKLIVCAPCCQKQVRKSIKVGADLQAILKHGILLERQAELLTDGIRAMLMESRGYKTKVFEFISSGHTPKNVMIVGRKTGVSKGEKDAVLLKVERLKELFGIQNHYLQGLLEDHDQDNS